MASSTDLAPENDSDSSISMVDVLQEEKQLEEDAHAVLGDSDDRNCTYPMGYVSRQALYACDTCTTCDSQPAGLCLACSYECHEGHDLHELYTKRNFRCDCGNSRLPDVSCKLYPNKESANSMNNYNQNFRGLYCTCSRPYPDPEDVTEDEMIQCILCEDWYHGRHLGTQLPPNQDYQEMICSDCMKKFEFLWAYNLHSKVTQKLLKTESSDKVEVCEKENGTVCTNNLNPSTPNHCDEENFHAVKAEVEQTVGSSGNPESGFKLTEDQTQNKGNEDSSAEKTKTETENGISSSEDQKVDVQPRTCEADRSLSQSQTNANTELQTSDQKSVERCMLKELQKREIVAKKCATFWPDGWRSKLCKCSLCQIMYQEKNIPFLVDEFDTVCAYEERGRAKQTPSSQYDKGLQALSNMNRVQQVEVLQGFNDLKSELSDYLRRFAENGKVVREEDIKEFFTQMESRKRQRTDGPMQYLCK